MAIDIERLKYIGGILWLSFVYYIVYTFFYLVVPEFIEYWCMGLIILIIAGALFVNGIGRAHNTIWLLLITLIDFGISLMFGDFGDFLVFVSGSLFY